MSIEDVQEAVQGLGRANILLIHWNRGVDGVGHIHFRVTNEDALDVVLEAAGVANFLVGIYLHHDKVRQYSLRVPTGDDYKVYREAFVLRLKKLVNAGVLAHL